MTKNIYIIHGFQAGPEKHWFPWLAEKINTIPNHSASILKMPNPDNPNFKQWLTTLAHEIPVLDKDTYIVAHSLGCITTLQHLNQLHLFDSQVQLGGILLVSGFYSKIPSLPQLNDFTEIGINFDSIKEMTQGNITVLSSANDHIVPSKMSDQLAIELEADYYRKNSNGHFLDIDGFIEFPLVLSLLKNMLET